MTTSQNVADLIRFVGRGDYGDLFPIFENNTVRRYCIDELEKWAESLRARKGRDIDKIVSLEAKGFVVGGMLAERLDLPFAPIAKSGRFHEDQKPLREACRDYSKSIKVLEITQEHIETGENVLLVDDWFESCKQIYTAVSLVEQCGAKVIGICGIVDNTSRSKIAQELFSRYPFYCVVKLNR